MITPETLKNIRRIELRTRKLVNNQFAGAYHAVFKGKGMVFDSVRPYQPGDDVRDIDWPVTARSGEVYVKHYEEERELTVMLLVDVSGSMHFGTRSRQKRELAAEFAAAVALSATTNNDQVGMLMFGAQLERYIPPRKGRNHVLRLIRDLLETETSLPGSDLGLALEHASRFLKQRAIIFVLSDFLMPLQNYRQNLLIAKRHHDVIPVVLSDPLERNWEPVGLVRLYDAETGAIQIIDSTSKHWRTAYQQRWQQTTEARIRAFARAGLDSMTLDVGGSYIDVLIRFFAQRVQHRAR